MIHKLYLSSRDSYRSFREILAPTYGTSSSPKLFAVICVIHEPVHGEECGKRVKRGLLKRTKLSKVLNADPAEACNILIAPEPSQRAKPPETKNGEGGQYWIILSKIVGCGIY